MRHGHRKEMDAAFLQYLACARGVDVDVFEYLSNPPYPGQHARKHTLALRESGVAWQKEQRCYVAGGVAALRRAMSLRTADDPPDRVWAPRGPSIAAVERVLAAFSQTRRLPVVQETVVYPDPEDETAPASWLERQRNEVATRQWPKTACSECSLPQSLALVEEQFLDCACKRAWQWCEGCRAAYCEEQQCTCRRLRAFAQSEARALDLPSLVGSYSRARARALARELDLRCDEVGRSIRVQKSP